MAEARDDGLYGGSGDDPLYGEAVAALVAAVGGEVETEALGWEALRRYLAGQVARLLNRNPALLLSLLYRIDVAEADVKHAFDTCSPQHLPDALADLLIERQIVKLRLRRQYGTSTSTDGYTDDA